MNKNKIDSTNIPDVEFAGIEQELAYTKTQLQITLEEMQITSEELRTSNDELNATNEELVTANNELRSRIDDVTALKNDIINLMNGAQVATIFLDNDLHIKRFTPAVVGTFNLRSIDVGRPITDITQNLIYETFEHDVHIVLDTLTPHECQVESTDGRWFIMRILPYMTFDDVIDGVVITFSDITQPKQMETALLRGESLSSALNVIHEAISSTHDIDSVMNAVVVEAAKAVGVDLGMITMSEDGLWVVRYVSDESKLSSGLRLTAQQAPYHVLIAETIQPTAINDTREDARISSEMCDAYGMRSILGIPLIAGKELLGVLSLVSTAKLVSFADDDIECAHKMGLAISLALIASRLLEAEHQAKLDAEVVRKLLAEDHSMLQQALLPGDPHITPGYQLATRFIPGAAGKQVGGDFYDVFETEDGKTAILIGDVSGKGIESAAMAAATRSTVRAFAYDLGDPAQALNHTNTVITQSSIYERFATAFLAVLDPQTGRFTYASSGHPPVMVMRSAGNVEQLNSGSYPIGVVNDAEYKLDESYLAPGDQIVMYTDGISESHNASSMLDTDGIGVLLKNCSSNSPEEILEALFKTALDFSGGHLTDDAAVVIIERSR